MMNLLRGTHARTYSPCSKAITVNKEIPVEIDLGLLAVFDPNSIDLETYQCVLSLQLSFNSHPV